MKISITDELMLFLMMTAIGLAEGLLFDMFRAVRKMARKDFFTVGAIDMLYWLAAGGSFAAVCCKTVNAEVRTCCLVGFVLGLIVYFLVFGDGNVSIITEIFIFFLKIFKFFLKILLTPGRFLYKMLLEPLYSLVRGKINCILKIFNIRKLGIKNDKKKK